MTELLAILSIYYQCAVLAEDWKLTQAERFACRDVYQEAKRIFLEDGEHDPDARLTADQNPLEYRRFKDWEAANADLVRQMKGR